MKNSSTIREIVVPADENSLNAAIEANQIEPDKIISVILQPRQAMASATTRRSTG